MGMVKIGRFPGFGGVALGAVVAEVVLHVVGIRCVVIIIFMAGEAICWGAGESISVAFGTIDGDVRSG